MIEPLCIAAEITAVLLILSIAMPLSAPRQRSSNSDSGEANPHATLLNDCEASLVSLRSLIYYQASRAYQAAWRTSDESQESIAVVDHLRDHLEAVQPLEISRSVDAVSHLPDLHSLEGLLEKSEEWKSLASHPTWIALLRIDHLDQLDDDYGPVGSERMLRELAQFFRERVGGIGPLVRFNHDSFAVALFDWPGEEACRLIESLRMDVPKRIATVGESPISTTASASLVPVEPDGSMEALWEKLEDGMAEAISAGANRGRWLHLDDQAWYSMGHEPEVITESDDESEIDEPAAMADIPAVEDKPREARLNETEATEVSTSSTRPKAEPMSDSISADDIASLFRAAHQAKASSTSPAKATTAFPATATAPANDHASVDASVA